MITENNINQTEKEKRIAGDQLHSENKKDLSEKKTDKTEKQLHSEEEERRLEAFLSSVYSDESGNYICPEEPEPGETVRIRLRTAGSDAGPDAGSDGIKARILLNDTSTVIPMTAVKRNGMFTWYEAELTCPEHELAYSFLIEWSGRLILYRKGGAGLLAEFLAASAGGGAGSDIRRKSFRVIPGFHTPEWSKGALQYQIMVDRFRNGDKTNDVTDNEYFYAGGMVKGIRDWDALPVDGDYRNFYGGDLKGVAEKLDYIQSLGTEVIYFNPIFVSPSSHKYDTQDYEHIDPHFGVIVDDLVFPLRGSDSNNIHAAQYIRRVTSAVNLKKSDELFAELCREIHDRGMKIILDGVFNHCGSFHPWMDREGIYAESHRSSGKYKTGAYTSSESPYRDYFGYGDSGETENYERWCGFDSLPKLNYEASEELREKIYGIACKWTSPPYSVDGWRLDVGADAGHSRKFNHDFWREFRNRVKAVNPDVLIVAEHYGDPSEWLEGDQWDSVMNYDAFMEPVTFFLTGMEKHSDYRRDDLYLNGRAFFDMMRENSSKMPWVSIQCAMNELSNHDHSRFLTRTNRISGRLNGAGSAAASKGTDKTVFREAAVIQMTWPGAPTIYYGDEAGLAGWTDPDNRRTYPWGCEDKDLIEMHRALAAMRRGNPVLRYGSVKELGAGTGWIAYGRFTDDDCIAVVVNNNKEPLKASIEVRSAGAADGEEFTCCFITGKSGWSDVPRSAGIVSDGRLSINMEAESAVVLRAAGRRS